MTDVLAKTWELIAVCLPYALTAAFFGGLFLVVLVKAMGWAEDTAGKMITLPQKDHTEMIKSLEQAKSDGRDWERWAVKLLQDSDVLSATMSNEERRKEIEALIKGASDGA